MTDALDIGLAVLVVLLVLTSNTPAGLSDFAYRSKETYSDV